MSENTSKLRPICENILKIIDAENLNYEETMAVVSTVSGCAIDAWSDSFSQAESSLHQFYRSVRTRLVHLEMEGELAYQKRCLA